MQKTNTMIDPKAVFRDAAIFSSFAVKDIDKTRAFYRDTLGLDCRDGQMGDLELHAKSGHTVMIYPKPDHQPAVFTVLNLPVRDIDDAVDALTGAGITMERYDGEHGVKTDAKGIARGTPDGGQGPSIAWFRDPSGNIVSVLEI
jgi:catechol 2,3-dioxygenase-like lactoylglutathione lyase family enzyme